MLDFICPYANVPLLQERPCCVSSCCFNLGDMKINRLYRRCFLFYVKTTSSNPYKLRDLERVEFSALPLSAREAIAKVLLDIKKEDELELKRNFYTALFSIMIQDTTLSVTKKRYAPVLYQQCCVCGCTERALWFPKGGILPQGFGYCSWACWQEMPPPILSLVKNLEVDFYQMLKCIPYPNGQKSKLVFLLHLIRWVFGDLTLK